MVLFFTLSMVIFLFLYYFGISYTSILSMFWIKVESWFQYFFLFCIIKLFNIYSIFEIYGNNEICSNGGGNISS